MNVSVQSYQGAAFAFKCTHMPQGIAVFSIDGLINALGSAHKNITALDLSGMRFDNVPKNKILLLINSISPTVEALRIHCSPSLLIDILQVVPNTITRRDLRGINLGRQNETYVINFLALLSPALEALDLRNCNLNELYPEVFHALTSSLPPKLVRLGLSSNNLFTMGTTPEQLVKKQLAVNVLSAKLPARITTVMKQESINTALARVQLATQGHYGRLLRTTGYDPGCI